MNEWMKENKTEHPLYRQKSCKIGWKEVKTKQILAASTHLYMRICVSVGRCVRRSVGPSIGLSVRNAFFQLRKLDHWKSSDEYPWLQITCKNLESNLANISLQLYRFLFLQTHLCSNILVGFRGTQWRIDKRTEGLSRVKRVGDLPCQLRSPRDRFDEFAKIANSGKQHHRQFGFGKVKIIFDSENMNEQSSSSSSSSSSYADSLYQLIGESAICGRGFRRWQ